MGAPVSTEVRAAIVRARNDRKLTYEQIAELLGIGRATVSRVLRLKRVTGDIAPRPKGGGWTSALHGKIARMLVAIVKSMSDATVTELTAELVRRSGIETSRAAVHRALGRLGYSRKKSPSGRWSATRPKRRSTAVGSAESSSR
jgi:transposase